jgi:RND family efflux transporter MFP subunit
VTTAEKALELMRQRQSSQVEQKKAEMANAEFKLKSAEEAVKPASEAARYSIRSTKERLERAQRDLDEAVIKAPVAGTVVLGNFWDDAARSARPFKVGDTVHRGTRVAMLTNISRLAVNLPIEETCIAPVKVGQEAILTFDAVPGKTYRGAVESIAASARRIDPWEAQDLKASARYFMVTVGVKQPDAKLRPALKCKARIVIKRLKNVLAVPLSAVIRRGQDDRVFVLRSSRFYLRKVKTGDRNEEAVVITAGLRPAEVIALEDPTAAVEE